MLKYLYTILFALALCVPVWAQENPAESGSAEVEDAADATEDEAAAEEDEEEEVDDSDLDEQTYDEDEDDFVPSEEIPVDEPIPFPSNI